MEYQGKQVFARYGIDSSPGEMATKVDEAVAAADRVGYPVVIKAQVHVGGRGKAGGVKVAATSEEARVHAAAILGLSIKGHRVKVLWIEKATEIAAEYYASFTLDRAAKKHLGMLSVQGGVEIETVAATDPDAVAKVWIDPTFGLTVEAARAWVLAARLDPAATEGSVALLAALYRCFVEGDCDLAEINPLVLTVDGQVRALDAKVSLDDNAAFRHPEWADFSGTEDLDERERLAKSRSLQYVGLDGSVGIIANGAGLAMSTVDVVSQVGGTPANFLDIGGGASAEVMAGALEVIDSDDNVRAIFINIFGGITRGEEVANGIVSALSRFTPRSPIVIRLDGTNAEEGREILRPHLSDRLVSRPTMLDAAREAVALAAK